MTITYPPELLPKAGPDEEAEVIIMQQTGQRQGGDSEMVLVPRVPTEEMIEAAWAAATAEDAAGVWRAMIRRWLQDSDGNSGSVSG